MTDVYLSEPDLARPDDYRYVANCAPQNLKSLIVIEGGSDHNPEEALDRLYEGLRELGLVSSYDEMKVQDDAGLLETSPAAGTDGA
ncbi:hypothetical protein GBA63_22560 (plasmid) [Rubrobacter tropicus]|uniref:Uncharacterized protein n=1 Tax=Rubrobacter tropicus TaxID=2653851 RepID=A0A6G8QG66_9ACTN|nr:hypothetical protein [Rubrobacter tropicus]QIN85485.1 hypothetical protein GBA63_22560 [Rubrobacter tropicus]